MKRSERLARRIHMALYRELLSIGYTLEVRSKIIRGAQ